MQLIHSSLLDFLTESAETNVRLRKNFNFHAGDESLSQRLLNALEPGTVMPVHRHRYTEETYVLLRGRIKVLFFNDRREPIDDAVLDPAQGQFGVNIPAGQWHSLEVLAPGTVIFECKDGPYAPLTPQDVLE